MQNIIECYWPLKNCVDKSKFRSLPSLNKCMTKITVVTSLKSLLHLDKSSCNCFKTCCKTDWRVHYFDIKWMSEKSKIFIWLTVISNCWRCASGKLGSSQLSLQYYIYWHLKTFMKEMHRWVVCRHVWIDDMSIQDIYQQCCVFIEHITVSKWNMKNQSVIGHK